MKKVVLLIITVSLAMATVFAQNPMGFNYQAIIRNASGEVIANQTVGLKISILEGSITGEPAYSETFTPQTNQFGLVNLKISSGQPVSGNFTDINWSAADFYLKVELDLSGGSNYQEMGTTQLLSVPYANYAFSSGSKSWEEIDNNVTTSKKVGIGTSTPIGMLEVVSDGTNNIDDPLFEVKNSQGETVFAVYENSVKIFVDEENENKSLGGFAVSGRTGSKEIKDIFVVTPEETHVYIDESQGKSLGGFAVSGRTSSKVDANILRVTTDLTQVFINESSSKTLGGFAVSGRTSTKSDETYNVLTVRPERTDIYIKPDENKFFPDGFTISGLDTNYQANELFSVSQAGTLINTELAVAPKLTTSDAFNITQVSAEVGGSIIDNADSEIIERGIVYTTSGTPSLNIDFGNLDPSIGGIVSDSESDTGSFTINIPALGYLNPGTTYYYRAYAINNETLTGYGDIKQFTTAYPSMLTFLVFDTNEILIGSEATITLFPFGDITSPIQNQAGDSIFYVADGLHNFTIEAPGFEIIEMQEVSVSGETYWDVYLQPELPKYTVIFEVERSDSSPAEGFDVSMYGPIFDNIQVTNASGIATFTEVPESQSYDVNIYKDGDLEYHMNQYDISEGSPYYDSGSGNIIIPVQLTLSKK